MHFSSQSQIYYSLPFSDRWCFFILLMLVLEKKIIFHKESSHIWFAVEIKWMVSIWNAKLVWNELSSSSKSLECKDLRLLIVYNKIEDPSKVLFQMCDVKRGWLLWTVYTSTSKNFWMTHIKNYTELSMTNQIINYYEHDQSSHQLLRSMFFQNQIQFRYQPEIISPCNAFLHHFIRYYYCTF